MTSKLPNVSMFTDGSSRPNPGTGGWAAVLIDNDNGRRKEISGREKESTNNRMELIAVIEGFRALKRKCSVTVYSDSQYVCKGITVWIHSWKMNDWETAAGTTVKNNELWQELDELRNQHQATFIWVKGHDGHPENERCDELAMAAIDSGT